MEFSASLRCIILLLLLLLFVFFRSKCAFSLLPYHNNLLVHVSLHIRIANHLVTDSCCRGGIVHSRRGCCCFYHRCYYRYFLRTLAGVASTLPRVQLCAKHLWSSLAVLVASFSRSQFCAALRFPFVLSQSSDVTSSRRFLRCAIFSPPLQSQSTDSSKHHTIASLRL